MFWCEHPPGFSEHKAVGLEMAAQDKQIGCWSSRDKNVLTFLQNAHIFTSVPSVWAISAQRQTKKVSQQCRQGAGLYAEVSMDRDIQRSLQDDTQREMLHATGEWFECFISANTSGMIKLWVLWSRDGIVTFITNAINKSSCGIPQHHLISWCSCLSEA